jgi:hypothetical protein
VKLDVHSYTGKITTHNVKLEQQYSKFEDFVNQIERDAKMQISAVFSDFTINNVLCEEINELNKQLKLVKPGDVISVSLFRVVYNFVYKDEEVTISESKPYTEPTENKLVERATDFFEGLHNNYDDDVQKFDYELDGYPNTKNNAADIIKLLCAPIDKQQAKSMRAIIIRNTTSQTVKIVINWDTEIFKLKPNEDKQDFIGDGTKIGNATLKVTIENIGLIIIYTKKYVIEETIRQIVSSELFCRYYPFIEILVGNGGETKAVDLYKMEKGDFGAGRYSYMYYETDDCTLYFSVRILPYSQLVCLIQTNNFTSTYRYIPIHITVDVEDSSLL